MMSSDKGCSDCSSLFHLSGNVCNVSGFQQADGEINDTFTFQNVDPIPTSGESWTCSFEKLRSNGIANMTEGSGNLTSDNKDEIQEADQNHSIQRDVNVNEDIHKIDAEEDQERNEIQRETKEQGFNDEKREIRMVMIGPTGSGKSKTGNTILGTDHFESKMKAVSVTSECKLGTGVRFSREVVIVDTPGVFDTHNDNEHIAKEIMKCIAMTTPGPHAFLLVLNPTVRFSLENKQSVDFFVKHFKKNFFDFLIVVFTRKDELEQEHMTIDEYLKYIPEELEYVLQKCGGKHFAINNRANDKEKEAQVSQLFQMINQMIENNNGKHYTNEFYQKNEKLFQKQVDKNLEKIDEKLKREQEEVYKNKCQMEKQKFEELKNEEENKRGRPLNDAEIDGIKILAREDTNSSVTNEIIQLAKEAEKEKKSSAVKNKTRHQIQNEDPEVTAWLSEGTKTLIKISVVSGFAIQLLFILD